MSEYLIVRGVECNNRNSFLCYSKHFFLHKKEKKGKKYNYVGDFFFTTDLKEAVDKFEEYKKWFDFIKKIDNKAVSFHDVLKKQETFKKKDDFINYLISEIVKLEEVVESLNKENETLKIELMNIKK